MTNGEILAVLLERTEKIEEKVDDTNRGLYSINGRVREMENRMTAVETRCGDRTTTTSDQFREHKERMDGISRKVNLLSGLAVLAAALVAYFERFIK